MIELKDVHLHYSGKAGSMHALRGIDLNIGAGEIFGIIGRSGAGKSSLVRIINLLNRPSSGTVHVDGLDLMALDAASLRAARRDIGMVFQHFNLLTSRTVFGNVALPLELQGQSREDVRKRVSALLDLVGLAGLSERYPAQISGGQKQRVGIARALACHPKVLLCDEATSSLDPETTRAILALLQRINVQLGLTIVLITHQMQVIRQIAQRVAVMEAGCIVEQGQVLEVFTNAQHPVTQSLIDEILPQKLPVSVLAHAALRCRALAEGQAGRLLRLNYAGELAEQPLLSTVSRRFGVDVSILHGQIDEIQGQTFGALAVFVWGAKQDVQDLLAELRAAGVGVKDVTDQAVGAYAQDASTQSA